MLGTRAQSGAELAQHIQPCNCAHRPQPASSARLPCSRVRSTRLARLELRDPAAIALGGAASPRLSFLERSARRLLLRGWTRRVEVFVERLRLRRRPTTAAQRHHLDDADMRAQWE